MFDLAAYGFDFSNREAALGFYTALFVVWAAWVARKSGSELVKAFCHPLILLTVGAMTAWVVICVALLAWVDAWEWVNLKTTILWWAGFAFVSLMQTADMEADRKTFGRLIGEAISVTAFIVFIAEFHSLPLIGELVLVPVATFLSMAHVIANLRTENAILRKPLGCILGVLGLGLLAYSAYQISQDWAAFANMETAREFGVPALLTLLYLPFIYCVIAYARYETAFTSLRIWNDDAALVLYAQWKTLLAFGLDIEGMKRATRGFRQSDSFDRRAVDDTIGEVKRLQARERHPPAVSPEQGWSPYAARLFLVAQGVEPNDYHRSFDEWLAISPPVSVSNKFADDTISYYVEGTEHAATRLKLWLNCSFFNDAEASDRRFYELVGWLLRQVFDEAAFQTLIVLLTADDNAKAEHNGIKVTLEREDWGKPGTGGYRRKLVITHSAHQGDASY